MNVSCGLDWTSTKLDMPVAINRYLWSTITVGVEELPDWRHFNFTPVYVKAPIEWYVSSRVIWHTYLLPRMK